VREWVDRVIQSFGQDDTPKTRERIAEALLKIGRGYVFSEKPNRRFSDPQEGAFYDEVDRRFNEDKLPAIRRMVAEMLFLKGLWIKNDNYENLALSILVFEEFETRFGKDNDPAILELYVRSLVEKGNALEQDKPDKAVAAYDDIISRYSKASSPVLRAQADCALLLKVGASKNAFFLSEIKRHLKEDETSFESERSLRAGFKPFLVRKLERFGIAPKDTKKYSWAMLPAVYEEADQYSVREFVDALEKRGFPLQQPSDLDAAFAVYEEIVQRFGCGGAIPLEKWREESQWPLSVNQLMRPPYFLGHSGVVFEAERLRALIRARLLEP
jgi:hypothetical protein